MSRDTDARLIDMNANAARQGFQNHEERLVVAERQIVELTNMVQTLLNKQVQLEQTNNLALQKLVGTGPTENGSDG